MGRVRGGQAPLVKEGQVSVNPWRHLLGGGVTGAGVTSSLQSGADKDVQMNTSEYKGYHTRVGEVALEQLDPVLLVDDHADREPGAAV